MPQKDVRARNWRKYNEALVQRGSVTFWFSEDAVRDWHTNDSLNMRGRPRKYSEIAIRCGLTLKAVFNLTFRAVEGFIKSLIDLFKIKAKAPDYTSLCKRQKNLDINFSKNNLKTQDSIHILVDSTGLKIFGEGEWKVRQHGYVKRRVWRKLHLAINAESQGVEAFKLTDLRVHDGEAFLSLIDEIKKPIEKTTGDGAYDQYKCYKLSQQRKFKLITPPKRDAKLTKDCTGFSTLKKHTRETLEALKQRNSYIERIHQVGRSEWKKEAGYHRRSLVETAMFRMKALFGDQLKTRKMENQITETGIRCLAFNKITSLGFGKANSLGTAI